MRPRCSRLRYLHRSLQKRSRFRTRLLQTLRLPVKRSPLWCHLQVANLQSQDKLLLHRCQRSPLLQAKRRNLWCLKPNLLKHCQVRAGKRYHQSMASHRSWVSRRLLRRRHHPLTQHKRQKPRCRKPKPGSRSREQADNRCLQSMASRLSRASHLLHRSPRRQLLRRRHRSLYLKQKADSRCLARALNRCRQ